MVAESLDDAKHVRTLNGVCYNAQQAIEKLLKAPLLYETGSKIDSHTLQSLFNRLSNQWNIKSGNYDLNRISQWVSSARYPDSKFNPPEQDEMRYGLQTA